MSSVVVVGVVTAYSVVELHGRFGGPCCIHHQFVRCTRSDVSAQPAVCVRWFKKYTDPSALTFEGNTCL